MASRSCLIKQEFRELLLQGGRHVRENLRLAESSPMSEDLVEESNLARVEETTAGRRSNPSDIRNRGRNAAAGRTPAAGGEKGGEGGRVQLQKPAAVDLTTCPPTTRTASLLV